MPAVNQGLICEILSATVGKLVVWKGRYTVEFSSVPKDHDFSSWA